MFERDTARRALRLQTILTIFTVTTVSPLFGQPADRSIMATVMTIWFAITTARSILSMARTLNQKGNLPKHGKRWLHGSVLRFEA